MNIQNKLLQDIEKGFEDVNLIDEGDCITSAQAPEPLTYEKVKEAMELMKKEAKEAGVREKEPISDYLMRMNFGMVSKLSPVIHGVMS